MDSSQVTNYGMLGAFTLFFAWRKWRSYKMKPEIHNYLQNGARVVDVRSPSEYQAGHFEGSLNIPLNLLEVRIHELDKKQKWIVCCASGGRSSAAFSLLKQNGFNEVINAGPWTEVVRSSS